MNPFNIFDDMDQMMGNMFGMPSRRRQRPMMHQQMIGFPGMPPMGMPQMPMMGSMMMPMMGMGMGMNMGMPPMGNMGMSMMSSAPGSTMSFSSTSISYGGGGAQPRVVQSTSNVRVGPNGVREEQQTYQNSHTGDQRMRLGRHINQRGHVMDQSRNRFTGQREEDVQYIGMREEEVQDFNQEWNHQNERAGGRRIQTNLAIQDSRNSHDRSQSARQQSRPQAAITQGVEIIELSDEEEDNHRRPNNQHYNETPYAYDYGSRSSTTAEPRVDFPDADNHSSSGVHAGQRRQVPDNDRLSPNSSNSDESSTGSRRQRNALHNLGKPLKSKKPRK